MVSRSTKSPYRSDRSTWLKPLWPRKPIEISRWDMLRVIPRLLGGKLRGACEESIGEFWGRPVCVGLSERSCFDRFLGALRLPQGSEVLVSAINIDGMRRILEEHGLVPVPVDICPANLEVDLVQGRERISSKTRAVLFAHLFGARSNMAAIVDFCQSYDLQLWEDCAQVFDGEYRWDERADLRLFSFGPIKTFSALGGGVAVCKDPAVQKRIRDSAKQLPRQHNYQYAARVAKYFSIQAVTSPSVYRWVMRLIPGTRDQRDAWLVSLFRNTSQQDRFFRSVRRQPSMLLLQTLERRIVGRLDVEPERDQRGKLLAAMLSLRLSIRPSVAGQSAEKHRYWVFPAFIESSQTLLNSLENEGFDVTSRCQLSVLETPDYPTPAAGLLRNSIVFLPCYTGMPEDELRRLVELLVLLTDVAPAEENRRIEENSNFSQIAVSR